MKSVADSGVDLATYIVKNLVQLCGHNSQAKPISLTKSIAKLFMCSKLGLPPYQPVTARSFTCMNTL